MRLRLYRMTDSAGAHSQQGPLVIDRFPYTLFDPTEWSPWSAGTSGLHECCEITLIGETLYVIDTSSDESTKINGQSVDAAPVLPGDRIMLNTTEFLVSYERLTSAPPPSIELLFRETGRPARSSKLGGQPASSTAELNASQTIEAGVTTNEVLA